MRYFSTQRPLTPGAFPKPSDNRVIAVENFDTYDGRMFCPAVSRLAYGYVDYEKPLTEEQSSDYELIPQKFPQYVKTYDGYIGVLIGLEYGEFPIYRFQAASGLQISTRLRLAVMPAPILNENIGGMNIGCTVFCFFGSQADL